MVTSESDSTFDDGDYVDWDSDEADEIKINAEPIERYRSGSLYYPVRVGEVLNQRYRIVHKLGHGGFSTVWMADDLQESKAVALKILVSGKDGETEFLAQSKIKQLIGSAPHILTYTDTFDVSGFGPDRHCHHILVMPLLGPNLDRHSREASMSARMSAAKQLLVALSTVHTAGMVYRDLNQGAIMWEMSEMRPSGGVSCYRSLGRPRKLDLAGHTTTPGDLVRPLTIPPELIGNTVYLGDFGMAIRAGESVGFKPQTPAMYCAPERYHDRDPSTASDMWSYMCIFAALYLGFNPFYGPGGNRMVTLWVSTLGPLPTSWKGNYRYSDSESDDAWYDPSRRPNPEMCLESKLARREPPPDEEEMKMVLSVFQKGFCYEPAQRISASELLEDASFNTLMAKYGCQG